MQIEIRKKGTETAILISFDTNTESFKSPYERNKFFSELHGRKQIVINQSGRYVYHRPGLMDEIPHIDVDRSVFIVAMEHMKRMEEFFHEWQKNVMFKTFPVLLSREEAEELKEVE